MMLAVWAASRYFFRAMYSRNRYLGSCKQHQQMTMLLPLLTAIFFRSDYYYVPAIMNALLMHISRLCYQNGAGHPAHL